VQQALNLASLEACVEKKSLFFHKKNIQARLDFAKSYEN